MIIATVQDEKVQLKLGNIRGFSSTAAKAALLEVGLELLRLSQEQVPHDTGELQNSGEVEAIGNDIIVGYHKPYAARLHEHPEYRFQKGRKGKYLEDPLIQNLSTFNKHVGESIEHAIRGI